MLALILLLAVVPPEMKSTAVMPLTIKGKADKGVGAVLDDVIVAEIHARLDGRMRVIGDADINAMINLDKKKQAVGCDSASCMAEIAGALGVDGVVYGSLGSLGGEYMLSISWLHQKNVTVIGHATVKLGNSGDLFLGLDGPAMVKFSQISLKSTADAVRGDARAQRR